jgi:hypothetical protein
MTDKTAGIFDVDQMNLIRDAHLDWCAEQSIDPVSPVGQQAAKMMFDAFQSGKHDRGQLIQSCDDFVAARQEAVRLGSPAIDSQTAE